MLTLPAEQHYAYCLRLNYLFLLIFGSEDFVKPATREELENREDIQVRMIPGGKHNIFDGNNIYAGRTLESIMRAVEQHC